MPKIYSRRKGAEPPPPGAVYVGRGRGSKWGNPYCVNDKLRHYSRKNVIAMYRIWARKQLAQDPDWLLPLVGKDLVCWCAPLPCHADVLLELIDEVYGPQARKELHHDR